MKLSSLLFAIHLLYMSSAIARGDEKTHEFVQQNCRYTLPGPDWSWTEMKSAPDTIVVAKSESGAVIAIRAIPANKVVDDRFMIGYEEGALKAGNGALKK